MKFIRSLALFLFVLMCLFQTPTYWSIWIAILEGVLLLVCVEGAHFVGREKGPLKHPFGR